MRRYVTGPADDDLRVATAQPRATVVVAADLGELAHDARAIPRGRVVAVEGRWTDDRRTIETLVTLEVDGYLKGALGDDAAVSRSGRRAGSLSQRGRRRAGVRGRPARHTLSRRHADRWCPYILGLNQGVYRIVPVLGRGGWIVTPPALLPSAVARAHRARRRRAAAARPGGLRIARAGPGGRCANESGRSCIADRCSCSAPATPASAYLKFGVRGGRPPDHAAMGADAGSLFRLGPQQRARRRRRAISRRPSARAFNTWQSVPTSAMCVPVRRPHARAARRRRRVVDARDSRAVPSWTACSRRRACSIDTTTGALIESDIFFNSAFRLVRVAPAARPGATISRASPLHEIGHFSGLGHSALGETELRDGGGRRVISAEAVMFPIAFAAGSIACRTLKADDIAGISDLYPDGDFANDGSVSGRVTKNGAGCSART